VLPSRLPLCLRCVLASLASLRRTPRPTYSVPSAPVGCAVRRRDELASLGVLRFTAPTRAWLLDFRFTGGHSHDRMYSNDTLAFEGHVQCKRPTFESGGVSIRVTAIRGEFFRVLECLRFRPRVPEVDAALGFLGLREWLDGRCLRRSRWSVLDNTAFQHRRRGDAGVFSYHRSTAKAIRRSGRQAVGPTRARFKDFSLPRRCTSENLDAALPSDAPRRIALGCLDAFCPAGAMRSRRLRVYVPGGRRSSSAPGLW